MAHEQTDAEKLQVDSPDAMARFTATGRPWVPPSTHDRAQMAMTGMGSEAVFAVMAPSLMPQRYTDNSLISVPVVRPQDIVAARNARQMPGSEVSDVKKKKSRFWRRESKGLDLNKKCTVKQVTRGEYLKHYAKDEQGRYCGTEEPAEDCILRGADLEKWKADGLAAT